MQPGRRIADKPGYPRVAVLIDLLKGLRVDLGDSVRYDNQSDVGALLECLLFYSGGPNYGVAVVAGALLIRLFNNDCIRDRVLVAARPPDCAQRCQAQEGEQGFGRREGHQVKFRGTAQQLSAIVGAAKGEEPSFAPSVLAPFFSAKFP